MGGPARDTPCLSLLDAGAKDIKWPAGLSLGWGAMAVGVGGQMHEHLQPSLLGLEGSR